jgi:hypothetical protein|tara:strand:- start:598 stop:1110 length:513 start_codon:yes stop_codon:yes gene_type:complete
MENVKENGSIENVTVETVKGEVITLGELYGLSRSVFELSSSVPSMKGKIVYALTKNEPIFEKYLTNADNERSEMLKNYVKLDKKGKFKYVKHSKEEIEKGQSPVLDYKSNKDKNAAATKIQNHMETVIEINLHKIDIKEFESLDIAPSRNTNIGLFIKYLVSETPIVRMN